MITNNFLIGVVILAASTGVLSMIMYMSVLSPGYIQFDERSKLELRIMNYYNVVMDDSFKVFLAIIFCCVMLVAKTDNIFFISIALYADFIYFTVTISAMAVMYGRSRLYWARYERR